MAKVKNISFKNVTFEGGFWKQRYDLNRLVSINSVKRQFENSGRFDALRFNYKQGKSHYPHIYYDSDVAKWIEAVAYSIIKNGGHEEDQKLIDELVRSMAKNQLENGYLNSHFIQIEPQNIFKNRGDHELYCAGHLIEAAIAYDQATSKHEFLQIIKKYVDCIERAFVTEKTANFKTGGHEEIELALIKLFDYTGDKKYLDLALFFINERGKTDEPLTENDTYNAKQTQSELPVRKLEKAEGHAVRAVYLYTATCEAYLKTGDPDLLLACNRLFDDVTQKKSYITGGVGSSSFGEAFTVPYDLPNQTAYSESCAALGMALFSLSMQQTELNGKFAAAIERIAYNAMLSAVSLDGKCFFYENPLEIYLDDIGRHTSAASPEYGTHYPLRSRLEVFYCSCCPPNLNRITARLGDFFFSQTQNELIVNQYGFLSLKNQKISLKEITNYPANGLVKFEIESCSYKSILLRKPEWCERFELLGANYELLGDYLKINNPSGEFSIDFKMQPIFMQANARVRADCGKVALLYGPTVYCLERIDNPYELNALSVDISADIQKSPSDEYPLPNLIINGFYDEPTCGLYSKATNAKESVTLKFRPYFSFANRGESDMIVWIRKK